MRQLTIGVSQDLRVLHQAGSRGSMTITPRVHWAGGLAGDWTARPVDVRPAISIGAPKGLVARCAMLTHGHTPSHRRPARPPSPLAIDLSLRPHAAGTKLLSAGVGRDNQVLREVESSGVGVGMNSFRKPAARWRRMLAMMLAAVIILAGSGAARAQDSQASAGQHRTLSCHAASWVGSQQAPINLHHRAYASWVPMQQSVEENHTVKSWTTEP